MTKPQQNDPLHSLEEMTKHAERVINHHSDEPSTTPTEVQHQHGEGHVCQKERTGTCCGGCKRPKP